MEQVRLFAVCPMENWLGSSLYQIQGWTTFRESYSRALKQRPLVSYSLHALPNVWSRTPDSPVRGSRFSLQNNSPANIWTNQRPKCSKLSKGRVRGSVPIPAIRLLTVHRAVKEISLRASSDPMQISTKRRTDADQDSSLNSNDAVKSVA